MDSFSTIIMLLMVFIAYVQGILWFAIGGLIVLLLLTKSILIFLVSAGGIGIIEFLGMQEYWFVVLFATAALILIRERRKSKEEDFYSTEMLDLLDEY